MQLLSCQTRRKRREKCRIRRSKRRGQGGTNRAEQSWDASFFMSLFSPQGPPPPLPRENQCQVHESCAAFKHLTQQVIVVCEGPQDRPKAYGRNVQDAMPYRACRRLCNNRHFLPFRKLNAVGQHHNTVSHVTSGNHGTPPLKAETTAWIISDSKPKSAALAADHFGDALAR